MKKKRKDVWGSKKDYVLLAITIITGAAAAILYPLGLIPQSIVLSVIVGLLTLFATSEILERMTRFATLENLVESGFEDTISSIDKVNVKVFTERGKWYDYICPRIERAKRNIDVTHFSPSLPVESWSKSMAKAIKSGVRVRRVVIFQNQTVLRWVKDAVEEFKDCDFYVGRLDEPPMRISLPHFLIIDNNEVAIGGFYRERTEESSTIWIKDKCIAEVLEQYFSVLWRDSTKLNEYGGNVHYDLFDQLEESFERSG